MFTCISTQLEFTRTSRNKIKSCIVTCRHGGQGSAQVNEHLECTHDVSHLEGQKRELLAHVV